MPNDLSIRCKKIQKKKKILRVRKAAIGMKGRNGGGFDFCIFVFFFLKRSVRLRTQGDHGIESSVPIKVSNVKFRDLSQGAFRHFWLALVLT